MAEQPEDAGLGKAAGDIGRQAACGFGLRRTGSAGKRTHRGCQTDQEQPFALEGVGRMREPVAGGRLRRQARSKLDQRGVASVETAQEMDRVRHVAAGIGGGGVDQGGKIRMASTAVRGNPRPLGFGMALAQPESSAIQAASSSNTGAPCAAGSNARCWSWTCLS